MSIGPRHSIAPRVSASASSGVRPATANSLASIGGTAPLGPTLQAPSHIAPLAKVAASPELLASMDRTASAGRVPAPSSSLQQSLAQIQPPSTSFPPPQSHQCLQPGPVPMAQPNHTGNDQTNMPPNQSGPPQAATITRRFSLQPPSRVTMASHWLKMAGVDGEVHLRYLAKSSSPREYVIGAVRNHLHYISKSYWRKL